MYQKTNWKDRVVEFVRRFKDQHGNTLILTPDEGLITEQGTGVTASRLNNIENGTYKNTMLYSANIQGTNVNYTTDTEGNVTQMQHISRADGKTIIRTDTFTYTDTKITEVRTLSTGETETFNYNFNVDGSLAPTEVI